MQIKTPIVSSENYFDDEIKAILSRFIFRPSSSYLVSEIKSFIDSYLQARVHNIGAQHYKLMYEIYCDDFTIFITPKNLFTMLMFVGEDPNFPAWAEEPEFFNGLKYKILYVNKEHFEIYPRGTRFL
jgi:hypothetical protein